MSVAFEVLTGRELRALGMVRLAALGRTFDLNSDKTWEQLQALPEIRKVLPADFKRDDLRLWSKVLEIDAGYNLVRKQVLALAAGGEVRTSSG